MNDAARPIPELIAHLKKLASDDEVLDAERIQAFRDEIPRVIELVENAMEAGAKAQEMLANAYSLPDDGGRGIRVRSEDAVKLQWALRSMGSGADDESFSV